MGKENAPAKNTSRLPPEGKGLILLGSSLILLLSLFSFDITEHSKNWLGLVGWGFGFGFNYLFGICSYLVLGFLGWLGWQYLLNRQIHSLNSKIIYFSIFLISCCLVLNLSAELGLPLGSLLEQKIYSETHYFDLPYPHRTTRYNLGGVPLYYLYCDLPTMNLQRMLSDVGIGLTFSITAFVSFFLLTEIRLVSLLSLSKGKFRPAKISSLSL